MTASLLNADRATYFKIIGVAAVAAIVVVAVAFNARNDAMVATNGIQSDGLVVKAGKPAAYSSHEGGALR